MPVALQAVWALVQALLETPEQQLAETAGFPLALALAYGIYTLKENKNMQLGKHTHTQWSIGCYSFSTSTGTLLQMQTDGPQSAQLRWQMAGRCPRVRFTMGPCRQGGWRDLGVPTSGRDGWQSC